MTISSGQTSKTANTSIAVVEAVAARKGIPPTELPALNDVVDPDALTLLFAGSGRTGGSITFPYCGYDVTVTAAGDVTLVD